MKRKKIVAKSAKFIGGLVLLLYTIFPVYWLMAMSVRPMDEMKGHISLIPKTFTVEHFTKWNIEDNGKRVLNKFYQAEITAIIEWLLDEYWDCDVIRVIDGNPVLLLMDQKYGLTEILVLTAIPHEERMNIIRKFLGK